VSHEKEFLKKFDRLTGRHQRARLFEDWVTMASSALIVKASPQHAEQSEADYMALVPRYTKDELVEFSHLLALTGLALMERPRDFLGHVFMMAEISNDRLGQFFTPYELSLVVAKMTLSGVDTTKELITVQEPACGSGGMVIAFAEAAREAGIDPAWQTYTVAVDISEVAARMAYIQLSMLGMPAHVVWGDTLRMTERASWPTLAYWPIAHKVERWRRGEQPASIAAPAEPEPAATVNLPGRYAQAAFDFA
jgi:type I restriction-modification system DNA methylase subunit